MIVDALGRIPMSSNLAASLARASGYAEAQLHRDVTLEHLLLALTEDADAGQILSASHIDVSRVVSDVSGYLGRLEDRNPPELASRLTVTADLKRILEAAAAASRGRRREINGAIVLAAIVGDGKTTAAHILRSQGLTFEEAIRVLQRALAAPAAPAAQPVPPPVPAPILPAVPSPQPDFAPASPPLGDRPMDQAQAHMPLAQEEAAAPPPIPRPLTTTEDLLATARERVTRSLAEPEPVRPAPARVEPVPPPLAASPPAAPAGEADPEAVQAGAAVPRRDPAPTLVAPTATAAPHDFSAEEPIPAPWPEMPPELPSIDSGGAAVPPPLPVAPDRPLGAPHEPFAPEGYAASPDGMPAPVAHPAAPMRAPDPFTESPLPEALPPPVPMARPQPPPLPRAPRLGLPQRPAMPGAAYPPAPPSFREPQLPPHPIYPPIPGPVTPAAFGTTAPVAPPALPVDARPSNLPASPPPHGDTAAPMPVPMPTPVAPLPAPQSPMLPSQPAGDIAESAAVPPSRGRRALRDASRGTASSVEIGQLVENIPRRMRVAIPVVVEVRIAKADVRALADGMAGPGAAQRHEVMVTKAMSVRLRAPDGGFTVEPASPETQWLENTLGLMADDFASWRWTVTPRRKGHSALQLVVAARTVGADGLAAETALPEQVIEVKVATNYARTARMWAGWAVAAVCGGILQRFGDTILAAGAKLASLLAAG